MKWIAVLIVTAVISLSYFIITITDPIKPSNSEPQCTHRLGKAQVVYRPCAKGE